MNATINRTMTITEMAQHYGVTTRLLRFWESQGIISPERWGRNGSQRRYSPAERRKFEAAREAQALGMTISQIIACQQKDGTVLVPADMLDELVDQAKRDRSEIMERVENVIEKRSAATVDGFATLGRTN